MRVLCVDFSKAFDCVEHEFISKVLGFFNPFAAAKKMFEFFVKFRTVVVISKRMNWIRTDF